MSSSNNRSKASTKIISDDDVGRQFSNGQVSQKILHKINIRPSHDRKHEKSKSSVVAEQRPQINLRGRLINRSRNMRRYTNIPAVNEETTCECDQSIQETCKRPEKMTCLCEGTKSHLASTKVSSLKINVPKFSHSGTKPQALSTGSKLGERSERRNDKRQPSNHDPPRKAPESDKLEVRKSYFEALISPDLTALPSETIPIVGHPARFRDRSFSVDKEESIISNYDRLISNEQGKSLFKKKEKSQTTDSSQSEFDDTKDSRVVESIHFPKTLFGFGPINNFTGNQQSLQPSRRSSYRTRPRVSIADRIQNHKTVTKPNPAQLRRQLTMECVAYPNFFSMFDGFTSNFTGSNTHAVPSAKSTTANSVKTASQITSRVGREPSIVSLHTSRSNSSSSSSYTWIHYAFLAALIWLVYLTYLALQSSGSNLVCTNCSKSSNGNMYGKYDGQIG